jgi:hypothetical protein
VRDNLDVIKARFTNRYTDVRGNTVDVYTNRVQLVIKDFLAWKADRSAWERDIASRQNARGTKDDGEKRRAEKVKSPAAAASALAGDDVDVRVVKIPLPSGFEVEIKLPRNLSVGDLRRVLWGLLPYATDWDPGVHSPPQMFPQLEGKDDLHP